MITISRPAGVVVGGFLITFAAACEQALGIKDAQLDPGDPTSQDFVCNQYCETIQAACAGQFQQYGNPAICKAVCLTLPLGEPGVDRANTVHCRKKEAESAQNSAEPAAHCHVAGPTGFDPVSQSARCGTNCEGFCEILQNVCPLDFAQLPYRNDLGACVDSCETIPDVGLPFNAAAMEMQSGNRVQCRLYHASAASTDPDTHCPHAALGEPPCVDAMGGAGGAGGSGGSGGGGGN